MLINAVSSSKTSASIGKCTWRSGWYLARRSRMAALQGKSGCHAPNPFSTLILLSCNTSADTCQAYLRSLPGCIFMTSNSFIRTVSKSCSLMLRRQGMFVDFDLDRFESKRHRLMFLTVRSMHYRLIELDFGKAPNTLAVFPVPADTSATPLNPLLLAQRPQPSCQAPKATWEGLNPQNKPNSPDDKCTTCGKCRSVRACT